MVVPPILMQYLGVPVDGSACDRGKVLAGGDEQGGLVASAMVQLHSLKAAPQHNGSRGVLVAFDADSGRWAVRKARGLFAGGVNVLNVKPANLTVVHPEYMRDEGCSPSKLGEGKSPADLVAALQALGARANPSAPAKGKRTSLARHLSTFTPNGGAWLVMINTYMESVQSGDKRMWQTLQDMAESTVRQEQTRRPTGEATLAMYLCGKLLRDDHATRMLRIKKDEIKAAWYWLAAAEQGLAYAISGLGTVMREGIPDLLKPDLNVAKNLWAKAFDLCDLPEAAHNLGVCYGLGHGGPVELSKAVEWYGAAKDCDLSGVRVGDAPKGRHGDLAALRVLGPVNDDQEDFIKTAVSDYRAVRREMGVKDGRDDVAALKAKGFHDLGNLMEKARKVGEGEEAADFGHIQEMMRVVRMMESGAKPNGSWGGKEQRKGNR
jgi:hypothetical protein